MPTTINLMPSGTEHIYLDERGRGWIDDTNVKVIQVVMDAIGVNELTPQQIREGYPHLSLAQIFAALSWYHDHKGEYDAEMDRLNREFDAAQIEQKNDPLTQRLRRLKSPQ